jgi:hypothetical protein
MQMMRMFRGRMRYNLTHLRLMCLLEYFCHSLKVELKGKKVNLDKERASTTLRYQCILSQVLICVLIAF